MSTPAVRQAEAAARAPFDGAPPTPGTQPRPRYPGRPAEVAPRVLEVVDLALGVSRGRLRRVPSAGALYPVDAHVMAGGRLLAFDPFRHVLRDRGLSCSAVPGAVVLLSLEPSRTVWKYGSRSLPSLLLDLGHAAGSLAAAAACLGVECRVSLDVDARRMAVPYTFAAVWLAPPAATDVLLCAGTAWRGTAEPGHTLIRQALDDLAEGGTTWEAPGMPPFPRHVIESRRSAPPPFTGELDRTDLHALLDGTPLIAATRDGLTTADGPVGRGDARPALAAWATGQAFLADAAAVLLVTADLTGYRAAYTRAGLLVHRALLAAHARGLPARPVGSWGPADLGAALGRPPGTHVIVHGAAIGGGKDTK
ncbi:nitroreductase family protein [Thermoactinospora rubra]|uniref:nitroreductase family protein n=1 Tax=Thermoactinospora rubra TaxID=1088767 RepID=UPI00118021DE|nr:nitroreductase family protein [Thermoactinospora rubra]